jgi:CDP-paratose 2-epimerase
VVPLDEFARERAEDCNRPSECLGRPVSRRHEGDPERGLGHAQRVASAQRDDRTLAKRCDAFTIGPGSLAASMAVAIVTGAGGLVGSTSVQHFVEAGYDVVGLENDMRARFFGPDASTLPQLDRLRRDNPEFASVDLDIRDADGIDALFARHGSAIELIVHTAAQPSHDWAAQDPRLDFAVNATGTLNLLEAARRACPDATFIYASTNKVYGDRPNELPLVELQTRLELPKDHRWFDGIDTSMPIDRSLHSPFGVS